MKVKYLKNENIYVLSNFGAASNPLFINKEDVKDFKQRIFKHLSGLCEIRAFIFHNDHYQILIKLKSRRECEKFYVEKRKKQKKEIGIIPKSTYIVSQEMANLQSGYAKRFNSKYRRFGVVFARRFTRMLVSDVIAFKKWIRRISENRKLWEYRDFWSYRQCYLNRYKGLMQICEKNVFVDWDLNLLRGSP